MLERKDITIECRKTEIVKEVRRLAHENMIHRVFYLCDIPENIEKVKILINEFDYLCNLQERVQKGKQENGVT